MSTQFPPDFCWGTATASFQIEGATQEDGRGESIWDRFAAVPNNILTGETGDPACDSYHRYGEDIAIMQELGVNAYRFSVAWPRIIPDGDGAVNPAGLDYYARLVDALLAADITPFITLYHWDLPQALQEHGGWANRDTIAAFVRFAETVVTRLGDRVTHWITHNEPWCISILSHEIGAHAARSAQSQSRPAGSPQRTGIAWRSRAGHPWLLSRRRSGHCAQLRARVSGHQQPG